MNFEENYLGIIVQTYEREAIKNENPQAHKVMSIKSIEDFNVITGVTRETISSFPGSKFDFEADPTQLNARSSKPIDDKALIKLNIKTDHTAFEDYLNKCFGCDFRLVFDWQFLPPDGFLGPIGALLKDISILLDRIKDIFSSKKKIAQFCALLNLFDGIPCPQDILNIIMALKVLLSRYVNLTLKLKIDWLTLLGPIIQGIASLLNYLVNFIFDALSAPLKCSLTGMQSGLALLRALDPGTFATDVVKKDPTSKSNIGLILTDIKVKPNAAIEVNTFQTSIGDGITALSDPRQFESQTLGASTTNTGLLIPTGGLIDVSLSDLLNAPSGQPWFGDLSLPEQLILAVSDAKKYLDGIRGQILQVVNSLNALVRTGKFIEIQSMVAIITLLEMIAFMVQLLNTDFRTFKNLCQDAKQKTQLEEFLKDIMGAEGVFIEAGTSGETIANITNVDGTVEVVVMNPCGISNNSKSLDEVKKVIEEIERLTKNG